MPRSPVPQPSEAADPGGAGVEDFRRLTLLAADWYWVQDAAFRFTKVVGSERAGGVSMDRLLGKTRWSFEGFEPLEGSWDAHRAQLQARRPFRHFVYLRRLSGWPDAWISINGEPVFGPDGTFSGYHGTARDVTHEILSERALRTSEERFRTLTMLTAETFWELDDQLRFTLLSHVSEGPLGSGSREPTTRPWDLPGLEPESDSWLEHRHMLEQRLPFRDFVYSRRLDDGTKYYALVNGEPRVDANGVFCGYIGTATDITARVRADHDLRELNADLEHRVQQRTAQLEAANRELEAFGYSIAHDLRAPLATVQGFAQVLENLLGPQADPRVLHYLSRIRAAGRNMGELTDGLLELANLSRQSLGPEPVDIADLARSALAACRELEPGREVEVQIPATLPAVGDPRYLSQVLGNLLGNAWKFTANAAGARIEVGRVDVGGEAAFFVRDNGAGFDMAHVGKLFEAFQRLHTRAEFEGTGIGLAIVHKIISRHGGRVWADAAPGEGACFFFTLPGTVVPTV